MIDKTNYGIVRLGFLTASGEDEILIRTILKKDCEWILKERVGNKSRQYKSGYEIRKLT